MNILECPSYFDIQIEKDLNPLYEFNYVKY